MATSSLLFFNSFSSISLKKTPSFPSYQNCLICVFLCATKRRKNMSTCCSSTSCCSSRPIISNKILLGHRNLTTFGSPNRVELSRFRRSCYVVIRASMVDSHESSSNFIHRMERSWLISQVLASSFFGLFNIFLVLRNSRWLLGFDEIVWLELGNSWLQKFLFRFRIVFMQKLCYIYGEIYYL